MEDNALAESFNITDRNMTWSDTVVKYSEQGFADDSLWLEIIDASTRSRTSVNQELCL